jgi:hypothetical protein
MGMGYRYTPGIKMLTCNVLLWNGFQSIDMDSTVDWVEKVRGFMKEIVREFLGILVEF